MGKMANRVSLQDIAREAGMHISTVSLALRDDPRLYEETRTRIKAIAARLGYQTNPLVSAWLQQVRKPEMAQAGVGLAFFFGLNASPRVATEPYYQSLVEGARAEAVALGYLTSEVRFGRDDEVRLLKALAQLRYRGVRGVLLFDPAECLTPKVARELEEGFAVVVMLRCGGGARFHRVGTEIGGNVALALQRLRDTGRRRICFPVKPGSMDRVRKEALAAYLGQQQLWPVEEHVPLPAEEVEHDPRLFIPWLRAQKADAVLSVNYLLHDHLINAGYRIPADLGFAHLGVDVNPALSGIVNRGTVVGRTAVFQLAGLIAANRFGCPEIPLNTLVPGIWREALEPPKTPPAPEVSLKPQARPKTGKTVTPVRKPGSQSVTTKRTRKDPASAGGG